MRIDLDKANLATDGRSIAEGILLNGELRKSRPRKASGETQYVWRIVAFSLSENPKYWCLPVGAEMYLGPDCFGSSEASSKRFALVPILDKIARAIVDTVPVLEQPGTRRWAQAWGIGI